MKNFIVLFLSTFIVFVSGCSMLNPGYTDVKPDISELKEGVSTFSEVNKILGNPASVAYSYKDRVQFYLYKTPLSKVDKTLMMKGSYSRGCINCGKIYVKYIDTKKSNSKESVLYSIRVVDPELRSLYRKGLQGVNKGEFSKSFKYIQKAAMANYVEAECTLGLMYMNGDGTKKDLEKSFYWLHKSARAGYPRAVYDLGAMFNNGEYVQKDRDRAKSLYILSANKGYDLAISELIKMYKEEKNSQKVKEWSEKLKVKE